MLVSGRFGALMSVLAAMTAAAPSVSQSVLCTVMVAKILSQVNASTGRRYCRALIPRLFVVELAYRKATDPTVMATMTALTMSTVCGWVWVVVVLSVTPTISPVTAAGMLAMMVTTSWQATSGPGRVLLGRCWW